MSVCIRTHTRPRPDVFQKTRIHLTSLKGNSNIDLKSKKSFRRILKNFYKEKMQKFKYGPLVWNSFAEEDESGNYYWNGNPPVEYDHLGIPIDEAGMQCLPIQSPVHPSWQVESSQLEYNDFLQFKIPSISSTREWFDENFLVVTDIQCKKYIIKWIRKNENFSRMIAGASSLVEMMDRIWPLDEHK